MDTIMDTQAQYYIDRIHTKGEVAKSLSNQARGV